MQSEIRKCGDQLLVLLPDELAAELGWGAGDVLALAAAGGALTITREQTAHDHAMEIARKVMDEYHAVFETLAKS